MELLPSWAREALPFIAMLTVACSNVGLSVISKAALAQGMNNLVAVVYSNALATLILLPYFLFFRKQRGAPITWRLLCRFFLLGFIGSTGQVLNLTALKLSSPTLTSALGNLIPIFTFLLAVIFRMEYLDIRKSSSQAKSLGAVVAVTGASIVTLYHGPAIFFTDSPTLHRDLLSSEQSDWILGGVLFVVVCLEAATWNMLQNFTLFVAVQSAVFTCILERSSSVWITSSPTEIAAIISTALFGSLFRIIVETWCLGKKGPVFVTMFSPLGIVIAAAMTVVFLGETLYLGSVLGSVVISLGFYSVMWGQMKEKSETNETDDCKASSLNTNLLRLSTDVVYFRIHGGALLSHIYLCVVFSRYCVIVLTCLFG